MTQSIVPTLEYTRSVCTCGKELSTLFYQLAAKAHFEKFATATDLIQEDVDNMGFSDPTELRRKVESLGLGFCCLMNLGYGIREPIAIITPGDQEGSTGDSSTRKYPEGLPGPLSKEKTLSWY